LDYPMRTDQETTIHGKYVRPLNRVTRSNPFQQVKHELESIDSLTNTQNILYMIRPQI
jgi:hypothetical protein